jgi:PAS domain S-box-containing protein
VQSATRGRAREEQLRLLVDAVADYAIFLLDPAGHVVTWNTGAERIKGYGRDEVVGSHFSRFYTPEDRERGHPERLLGEALRDGRVEDEGWRVRRDGTRFWASVVITALRDEGELLGFGKVTRDLTERQAAEEQLRTTAAELARANAELERFAAAAAHDLAEPLHTITGFAEVLRRRYGAVLDDEGREVLDHISEAGRRLGRRIEALLTYARSGRRELRPRDVDLAALVAGVVEALAARIAQTRARVEVDPGPSPVVVTDPDLLEVVVQNLVANALKFTDRERPHVRIAVAREAGRARIDVADDGIGIPPGQLERVFGLFARASGADAFPGSGLGLALSRRIVERLGGEVAVASTPGAGSTFSVVLPA